jgi:hypothetical protein
MIKTDNLEEVLNAEKYGRIEQTRFGGYRLVFPTKLNEEIKGFMGSEDFEMDVIKEGEHSLMVTLTPKKFSENKAKKTLKALTHKALSILFADNPKS